MLVFLKCATVTFHGDRKVGEITPAFIRLRRTNHGRYGFAMACFIDTAALTARCTIRAVVLVKRPWAAA